MKEQVDLIEVFYWGVGYGQLLMEEERDAEDWGDAFQGYVIGNSHAMPSQSAPRRLPKPAEWRQSMRAGYRQFLRLLKTDNDPQLELEGLYEK
jgi:hypothetical protein